MIPGTLKGTKAIGWFIPEYGVAQVSMNITDIKQTRSMWRSMKCAALRQPAASG